MKPQHVDIPLPDGRHLSGRLFHQTGVAYNQAILIASGTGFLQKFYAPLATWLAGKGYTVLTFDYDGIGDSLHGELKHNKVRLQDWGTRDIPAALDYLLQVTQLPSAILIGHSAGGQMLGVMPNHAKVSKLIAISASSGHIANMKPQFARKAKFLFQIYMPISHLVFGYANLKAIKWGENLPKGVAKQWAQWCLNGHYVKTAIDRGDIQNDFHPLITQPITAIYAEDDDIVNEANVYQWLSNFPNAIKTVLALEPQQHGLKHIGHNALFRPSHQSLWSMVLREIQLL